MLRDINQQKLFGSLLEIGCHFTVVVAIAFSPNTFSFNWTPLAVLDVMENFVSLFEFFRSPRMHALVEAKVLFARLNPSPFFAYRQNEFGVRENVV
jgi:hypothetical protein